jgi:hypothetical protein
LEPDRPLSLPQLILDRRAALEGRFDDCLETIRSSLRTHADRWPILLILVQVALGLAFLLIVANLLYSMVMEPAQLGSDARLYFKAAAAALNGASPWAVEDSGTRFAAPPATLLPYIALQPLGQTAGWALMIALSVACAIVLVARLRLGPAFLLFPPLVIAAVAGNPEPVMVLALLIPWARWVAPVFKIYALVPLVAQRYWTAAAIGIVVSHLSVPLWPRFFAELSQVAATFAEDGGHGFSVYGNLVASAAVLLLLTILGRERAGWLAVPLLWPGAQAHYAIMALPAIAMLIHGGSIADGTLGDRPAGRRR